MLKKRDKRLLVNQPEYKQLWAELPMKPAREYYPEAILNDDLQAQIKQAAQFAPFIDELYRSVEVETVATAQEQESKITRLATLAGSAAIAGATIYWGLWFVDVLDRTSSHPPFGW